MVGRGLGRVETVQGRGGAAAGAVPKGVGLFVESVCISMDWRVPFADRLASSWGEFELGTYVPREELRKGGEHGCDRYRHVEQYLAKLCSQFGVQLPRVACVWQMRVKKHKPLETGKKRQPSADVHRILQCCYNACLPFYFLFFGWAELPFRENTRLQYAMNAPGM